MKKKMQQQTVLKVQGLFNAKVLLSEIEMREEVTLRAGKGSLQMGGEGERRKTDRYVWHFAA